MIISPSKELSHLNLLHPRKLCAKLIHWFQKKIFQCCQCIFVIISPRKGLSSSFEQAWTPFTKECFVPFWLKFTIFFFSRFLNVLNKFSPFLNCLPLEKGMALHLNKLEFPSPKDAFCLFGWNLPNGSGEGEENVNILQRDGHHQIRKAHLSFQVCLKLANWFWRRRRKGEQFTKRWTKWNEKSSGEPSQKVDNTKQIPMNINTTLKKIILKNWWLINDCDFYHKTIQILVHVCSLISLLQYQSWKIINLHTSWNYLPCKLD